MKFVSFAGTTFAGLNVSAALPNDTPDRDRQPVTQSRIGVPALISGMAGGPRSVSVYFMVKPGFDTEQTLLALLAALDQDHRDPRALVAQLNDGTTNVQVSAWPGSYVLRPEDKKGILVPFYTDDDRWAAVIGATDGPTDFAAAGNRPFTVTGQGRVKPTWKLSWKVQRPATSATMGWSYMRQIVVTNGDVEGVHNHPFQIGWINTAALVAAGKMRSDAADLVVFNDQGQRLRHGIAGNGNGTNNRATFLWFVIDELAAGSSRTYYVAYGNPNASAGSNAGFPYNYPGSPSIDTTAIDGQAFGAGGAATLPTSQTLDPNRFVNSTVIITGGSINVGGQMRRVASLTAGANSVLTVGRNWNLAPDTTTGYVVPGCGFKGDGGAASSATATKLVDSSQAWGANEWENAIVEIITLNTTMGVVVQSATVLSSDATSLTVASWPGGTPSVGAVYRVYGKNMSWIWRVDQTRRTQTTHRGRWRLSSPQPTTSGANWPKPTAEWMALESPAAWTVFKYNPADAQMDFAQQRQVAVVVGGNTDYFAPLYARCQRKDLGPLRDKGYGNGVRIHVPYAIGIRQDYQFKNPSGAFKAVFGYADRLGSNWGSYLEDTTTHAGLTPVATAYTDLTGFGIARHLMTALTSVDDADVPKTQSGTAELWDNTVLQVVLDPSRITATDFAAAVEEPVYDFALTLRRGASAIEGAGDDVVKTGGDEHHVFLRPDQQLWIGPDGDLPYVSRIYSAVDTNPNASDTLTDANGTAVQAHVPSGGGTFTEHTASGAGDATIDANRAHNANSSTTHTIYHSLTPVAATDGSYGAADYTAKAGVVLISDNNLSMAGPCIRIDTVADTCYWFRYNTNGDVWQLVKVVAGVITQIGSSSAQTLTVGQEYAAQLFGRGSKLVGLVDGVPVCWGVDTAISAAGKGGMRFFEAATSAVGVHLDNFAIYQGYLTGKPTYVRDAVNQTLVRRVEALYSGVAGRVVASDALPLAPGSQTYYLSDDDGSIGTVSVQVGYTPTYM